MEADLQSHVAFYLTGKRLGTQLDSIEKLGLRPALFAGYRDLARLRYDFPLILVDANDTAPQGAFVETLSGAIDGILSRIARGDDERIRQHLIRLEQAIRARVAGGERGRLSTLWDQAAETLVKDDGRIAESLTQARANLRIDGEIVDCDAELPFQLFGHAWNFAQRQRAVKFGERIRRLVFSLSAILQAEHANSDAGRSAEALQSAFGNGPMDRFDFDAMSRLLNRAAPQRGLAEKRRQRVEALLATLQSQRFFPVADDCGEIANAPYVFAFETCAAALDAYRERLPKAIELARAVAIAELEIKSEYDDAKHDLIFQAFGENGLDTSELALFPDYLVRLNIDKLNGPEQATLNKILSAELPIKVLVQTDDVIEKSSIAKGHLAFAMRCRQLAGTALAMGGAFVMQTPAANIYALRQRLQNGLDFEGPALFSVFSGVNAHTAGLPAYLVGAAALESRVFPAFTFDPSAGRDWAARFSLATNPEAECDWPLRDFTYEDAEHRRIDERLPFTLVDFAACDARYVRHFARVPRQYWNDSLTPLGECLARQGRENVENVPFLPMIDADDTLHKVIPDEKMIREARRCRAMWNSLQELGGIHNSHAAKQLARERVAWEEAAQAAPTAPQAAAIAPVAAPAPDAAVAQEQEAEKPSDEAYIKTARCSSCNECVQINGKMFVFDENRQAYIADIAAGTYAQLVEAAENCPVAIIHPGKPRNPNEPGLDELIKRAEAFL